MNSTLCCSLLKKTCIFSKTNSALFPQQNTAAVSTAGNFTFRPAEQNTKQHKFTSFENKFGSYRSCATLKIHVDVTVFVWRIEFISGIVSLNFCRWKCELFFFPDSSDHKSK